MMITEETKQTDLFKKVEPVFAKYYGLYTGIPYQTVKDSAK